VSAFFAGFVSVFMYFFFWWLGSVACNIKYVPIGIKMRGAYGAKDSTKKVTA
jgi:hypothetical protein